MKVVWTFVMITFAMTMVLYLGGIIDPSESTALGLLNGIFTGNFGLSEIWILVIGFIAVMSATSLLNSFTGGNASVGITAGYAAFAAWCVHLVSDMILVMKKVSNSCDITSGLCLVGYYITWFIMGLIVVGFIYSIMDLVGGND